MLCFHCLLTAWLAWSTRLTFNADEGVPVNTADSCTDTLENRCHVGSDDNFTSCDAATKDWSEKSSTKPSEAEHRLCLVWVLAGLDSRQCTPRAGFVPWPPVSCALVDVEQSEKTWPGSSFLFLRTFCYMWLLHLFVEGTASKENATFQVSVPHVVVKISNELVSSGSFSEVLNFGFP